MIIETIQEAVILYAPTVAAIIAMIIPVVKAIKLLKDTIASKESDQAATNKALEQVSFCLKQNEQLIRENKELKEMITHVKQD